MDQEASPDQKAGTTLGTVLDDHDMQRMGKAQELKVCQPPTAHNFRSHIRTEKLAPSCGLKFCIGIASHVGIYSNVSVLLCNVLHLTDFSSNYEGLYNGGLPGLFYSYIWTFVGFGFIIASISEMASMAPTSGGQYHWVSEWSSPRYQKFLSYITGEPQCVF